MAISEGLGWRRNHLLVASVLLLVPGLGLAFQQETKAAAEKISATLEKQGRKSVAVVDFTDLQGSVTELGRFMAEQLSVALASEDRSFKVIDRGHLRKILREQGLGSSGVIDPTTAQEVGRIAGVDTLITGTLTPFGETVSLSIKALDTKTAENIRAMSAEIPKTQAVEELLRRGVGIAEAGSGRRATETQGGQRMPEAGPPLKAKGNGFLFELKSCGRRPGGSVVCEFLITSQDEEQTLWLQAQGGEGTSECIDRSGRTVPASLVRSGSKSDKKRIGVLFHKGVPILTSFEFEDVNPTEKAFKAIIVAAVAGANWGWFPVFRIALHDVPIGEASESARPNAPDKKDRRTGAARFWGLN